MRLARDLGTVDHLIPPHINGLMDLPAKLAEAIHRALTCLSFDELLDDERPPRRIWTDNRKLKEWFAQVSKRRQEKYGGSSREIEDPVQNQAAQELLVG